MGSEIRQRLALAAASLVALFAVGTAGYVIIEGWPWFDALYMTTITLATIGYGEVHPLSNAGRAFTMALALVGLGTAAYSFSVLTAFIIEGQLTDVLRRRTMAKRIEAMEGHYIICGGGNAARAIAQELSSTRRDFVIVEKEEERARALQEEGFTSLHGDTLHDETLRQAGIDRAAGVFCVLANDRDNVFVAISARSLNPKIRIVSEIHDEHVRPKLLRGGADAAVSSNLIGGLRMASEMVRPATVGFLDSMIRDHSSSYRFEELPVPPGSPLAGRPIGEVKGSQADGALLLAVRGGGDGRYDINPPPERPLSSGEVLVVIGDAAQVGRLKERLAA